MHKRRGRGISPVVTAIMLVIVGIAAVLVLWQWLSSVSRGTSIVQLEAIKVSNRFIDEQKQVAVIALQLTSKASKELTIKKVTAVATSSQGNPVIVDVDLTSGNKASTGGVTVEVLGSTKLMPGTTNSLHVVITADLKTVRLSSVSFTVTLEDVEGHKYTYQSNAVDLT